MSYFVPESIVVPLLDVSKVEYACHTLASAEAEVRALLLDFKLVLDRTDGYGMKIHKFHQKIHG